MDVFIKFQFSFRIVEAPVDNICIFTDNCAINPVSFQQSAEVEPQFPEWKSEWNDSQANSAVKSLFAMISNQIYESLFIYNNILRFYCIILTIMTFWMKFSLCSPCHLIVVICGKECLFRDCHEDLCNNMVWVLNKPSTEVHHKTTRSDIHKVTELVQIIGGVLVSDLSDSSGWINH